MNWRTIRAIARKDLMEVRGNRMAWMPALVVPLIFCLLLPLLVIVAPVAFNLPVDSLTKGQDIDDLLRSLPPVVQAQIAGMNEHQTMIYFLLALTFAPLFLILPIMTASIIGADSFAGEKERKTVEALLYTPSTDRELFLGKMLASVLPALAVTWLAFVVYTLVLNLAGAPIMGRIWFPTPSWWPLILWVAPAVAVLGMLGAVLISARVSTFMEAYQSTGLLVLPIIVLVVGQGSGVVYLGIELTLAVGAVIWLIDAVLLVASLRLFSRAALFGGKQ